MADRGGAAAQLETVASSSPPPPVTSPPPLPSPGASSNPSAASVPDDTTLQPAASGVSFAAQPAPGNNHAAATTAATSSSHPSVLGEIVQRYAIAKYNGNTVLLELTPFHVLYTRLKAKKGALGDPLSNTPPGYHATSVVKSLERSEIYGARADGDILTVTAYPLRSPMFGAKHRGVKSCQFKLPDASQAADWATQLMQELYPERSAGTRPRYLVIANPKAGKGKAVRIWHKELAPLFAIAGADTKLLETTGPGHAADLAEKMDWHGYAAVVTVGGDGTANEVLEGIMRRRDWADILHDLPLALVPAGSGNGVAASLGVADVAAGVLAVLRGKPQSVDMFSMSQAGEKPRWGFLNVIWAMVSSIDLDSEPLRKIGDLRYDLYAIKCIMARVVYKARLMYLPVDADVVARDLPAAPHDADPDPEFPGPQRLFLDLLNNPEAAAPPEGWVLHERQDFLYWVMTNFSHGAADCVFHHLAKHDDGGLMMSWAHEMARGEMLDAFGHFPKGTQHDLPHFLSKHVRAMMLAPENGRVEIDGEEIPAVPTLVQVHPGALKMLVYDEAARSRAVAAPTSPASSASSISVPRQAAVVTPPAATAEAVSPPAATAEVVVTPPAATAAAAAAAPVDADATLSPPPSSKLPDADLAGSIETAAALKPASEEQNASNESESAAGAEQSGKDE